jgi:hypothetical protein
MEPIEKTLWSYVRGNMDDAAFEAWANGTSDLEQELGKADYAKIVALDYHNPDAESPRGTVWEIVARRFPRDCRCNELHSLAVIDMGDHEDVFRTLVLVRKRGPPHWWLSADSCNDCGQTWLVACESRINDVYIMRLLDDQATDQLLEKGVWPDEFDRFERLLEIGLEAGRRWQYVDLDDSPSLLWTIADLARERPNIPLTKIASLLNLSLTDADVLARRVAAAEGVVIGFLE